MTTFRLSEFAGLAGLEVVRDGVFAATGKLSTPLDGLLVPLRKPGFADEVNANPRIAAVIAAPDCVQHLDPHLAVATAIDPDAAHSEIHARRAAIELEKLRAIPSVVDPTAKIDPSAKVSDFGVVVGANAWVGPNCVIYPGVSIASDCVLHAGTAIGVPGFNTGIIGGRLKIIPQIGGVTIGEHVELLANCSVARAIYGGSTQIAPEVVTDSSVYIAHDVQIGRRVQVCAMAVLLGRVVVGDEAYIGPGAVVKNGIKLGAKARVSIGAVVTQNVPSGATVSGNFAVPHHRFLDHIRSIR